MVESQQFREASLFFRWLPVLLWNSRNAWWKGMWQQHDFHPLVPEDPFIPIWAVKFGFSFVVLRIVSLTAYRNWDRDLTWLYFLYLTQDVLDLLRYANHWENPKIFNPLPRVTWAVFGSTVWPLTMERLTKKVLLLQQFLDTSTGTWANLSSLLWRLAIRFETSFLRTCVYEWRLHFPTHE